MGLLAPWLLAEQDRFALPNGDYRIGNMLFYPNATGIAVVDWQTLGVGLLAYLTVTRLQPELRSEIAERLVEEHRRELSGQDRETCWRDYRLGMLQALLISALRFAFATATDRGDDMVLTMLGQDCQAIRDLGTSDLVRRNVSDEPTG
jgi:hypothetical protein